METNSRSFFNQNNKIYTNLKCNFRSNDYQIKKSYIDLMQKYNNSLEETENDEETQKTSTQIENLLHSYGIIVDQQVFKYNINFI